ncbi:MAG TPA: hypothetical protein PLI13_16855, partial [Paracoccus sp. (in: a-proteobacteria)]|nr:hypothetical protein [Paracoccus sp. (in: a-proteobacteria)]
MRIAGLGFRSAASLASLTDALDRAGPADALATSTAKAQAPVIVALARARGLPLIGVKVAGADLATIDRLTGEIERALKDVPGVSSALAERLAGGRYVDVVINRQA